MNRHFLTRLIPSKWKIKTFRVYNFVKRNKSKESYFTEHHNLKKKRTDIFFGYYDINPFNDDKIIAMGVGKKEVADVYVISNGIFNKIGDTRAWCWQQGSRLRWFDETHVIYNDFNGKEYISTLVNIYTKEKDLGKIICL